MLVALASPPDFGIPRGNGMPKQASFDAGQIRLLELIATGAALETILMAIVRLVEVQADGIFCSVVLLDSERGVWMEGVAPSLPAEYMRALVGQQVGPDAGSCGAAASRKERVITCDIESDPAWARYRHLALSHGLRSSWSTPIFAPGGTDTVLGTFAMYYVQRGRQPSDEESRWVGVATHLAAIAIVRDRTDRALKKSEGRAQQLARLYDVSSSINEALLVQSLRDDESEFFLAACRIAVEKGFAVAAWVGAYDETEDVIRPIAKFGKDDGYIDTLNLRVVNATKPPGPGVTAIRSGEPAISNDFTNDPLFLPWRDEALKRGFRSGAAVPLRLGERGKGILAIYGGSPGFFREEEVHALRMLGENISFAVECRQRDAERRRLFNALHEREEHLRLMQRVGEVMRAAPDTTTALNGALRVIGEHLRVSRVSYADIDPDQEIATLPHEYVAEGVPPLTGQYRLSDFITGHTLTEVRRGANAVVVHDTRKELPAEDVAALATLNIRAFLCRSLVRNGVLRALIAVQQDTPRHWTEGEVRLFAEVIERCWAATEHQRAEAALRKHEEGLRQAQKMEAVGKLAGGVAHDFNNLLAVILSYASLLDDRRDKGSDDVVGVYLGEIKKAALKAGDLTRQLLTFSRQQMLQPRVVDLNRILSSLEKMLKRLVPEDVTMTLRHSPQLGHVLTDPSQIEQVVVNLVTNACDAMPKGGSLTIETRNTDAAAVLVVRDTGVGMDAATIGHIFEPFFTTKARGRGTGLGLAMVYGFVTQSGGHINVSSEVGRGTAFEIFLPIVDAALDADEQSGAPSPIASGRGTETVLIVEDVEQVRRIVRSILERAGYVVLEAADGVAALAVASQYEGEIHLLLTDVVMPGMGGRDLADKLAATRPTMKVLYMSGYTEDSIVERGVLISGISFLAKPFTPSTLLLHVREALERKTGSARPIEWVGVPHVLWVDDEVALLQLIERAMKKRGYKVTSFTNPRHALRALEDGPPSTFDAIVTDVGMPEIDGFDFANAARRSLRGRGTVIITSGHFDERDRAKATALGIPPEMLVIKPDTIEGLGQRVHEAIQAAITRGKVTE